MVKNSKKSAISLIVIAITMFLNIPTTSAMIEYFENQNIPPYYNPSAALYSQCGGSLSVTGDNNVEIVLGVLTGAGMTLAQAAGVAGNLVVESGSESIDPAAEEFPGQDRGGKGVVQWTADRWRGPDGLREFSIYRVKSEAERLGVKYDEAAQSLGVTVGAEWSDMTTQMEFMLWEVGEGTPWVVDLSQYDEESRIKKGGAERDGWLATLEETTPAGAAETWMLRYERPSTPHLDRRIAHAERIHSKYSGSSIIQQIASLASPASANCGPGAISGDIVTTAKNFSHPHRVALSRSTSNNHGESAAKPEYVKAVREIHSDINTAMFTDCGVFISTIMRASGADPDYPLRGTSIQLPYVENSPKYHTFTPSSEAELQPGDILIRPGHTYMYVGSYTAPEDGREYKAVGASWFTRPPSGHSLYLSGSSSSDISSSSSFRVARYIGG